MRHCGGCGEPCDRPGQRYCKKCHNKAAKRAREKQKFAMQNLRAQIHKLRERIDAMKKTIRQLRAKK